MNRRSFLGLAGAGVLTAGTELAARPHSILQSAAQPQSAAQAAAAAPKPDFTLRIEPVTLEIAPGHLIHTIGYNGKVPGPVLRMREGQRIAVEVINATSIPEIVHWHGQLIPSEVDGSWEEGTPVVPARGWHKSYSFEPRPAGTRWYHTHDQAGRHLDRALYTGQYGFVYVEPASDPARYDREVFLALHDWEPFLTHEEDEEEEEGALLGARFVEAAQHQGEAMQHPPVDDKNGLEIGYKSFSMNDKALGHGEPIRVKQGERVMFRILNASATEIRRLAFPGHHFNVMALDGNPVPNPNTVETLGLGPAERIDAVVEMNNPGVWIFGTTHNDDRRDGLGIVVEYANQSGPPKWIAPAKRDWDYTLFGGTAAPEKPDETFHLAFTKIKGGTGGMNMWQINGKSWPHTDPMNVRSGGRYRMVFDNKSDDAHPIHLHRHLFELTKVVGKPTSGVMKDTVVVPGYKQVEVDFTANNPGLTLFHCHQQMHMDFGFMSLMKYV